MFSRINTKKQFFLALGDSFLIILSFYLTLYIRFFRFVNALDLYTGATFIIVFFYLLTFYIFGLYEFGRSFRGTYFITRFMLAVGLATVLVSGIFYSFPWWKAGRGLLLINMVFVSMLAYAWRLFCQLIFKTYLKPKRILIVGAGYAGKYISGVLKNNPNYSICGFLDDDAGKHKSRIGDYQVLGGCKMLAEIVEEHKIESVVVAITHEKHVDLLRELLNVKLKGVEIYDLPTFYEEVSGKIPVSHLREGWIVYATFQGMKNNLYIPVKRFLDISLSLLLLVLLLPFIAVTAIFIKLDSPGSVFYRQKRVGYNNIVYTIFKFRSMVNDAETGEAVWAKENDDRITRFGKFMRKFRIDEIPQLWNVLAGEMSFIGPRPERPEIIEGLILPFYALRHVVKPGITGWAQVNYRYGASREDSLEKLKYDIYYLKNLSFILDLQIILKTINVVFFREGAR
ncbi:MAG: sugar transferase [Candidatus Omnitrophota bacterium]|jgi:sugar transferase (PEP-CTERM system associated)